MKTFEETLADAEDVFDLMELMNTIQKAMRVTYKTSCVSLDDDDANKVYVRQLETMLQKCSDKLETLL